MKVEAGNGVDVVRRNGAEGVGVARTGVEFGTPSLASWSDGAPSVEEGKEAVFSYFGSKLGLKVAGGALAVENNVREQML